MYRVGGSVNDVSPKCFTLRLIIWLEDYEKQLQEAAVQRCSTKRVFLKILQSVNGNTYAGVTFYKSCKVACLGVTPQISLIWILNHDLLSCRGLNS